MGCKAVRLGPIWRCAAPVAQVAPACSERGRASQWRRCPETEQPSGETVVHSTQVAVQQGDGVDLLRLATAVPLRLCDGEDD